MFEGEYLNGIKYSGNGLRYNDDFELIAYELKNGTGKVREIFRNDDIVFDGEYLNGKKKWKRKRI